MAEGQMQRAVSAHGNSGDAPSGAPLLGAISFLDLRQKFPEKEILITAGGGAGIYVETGNSRRGDDQPNNELMKLPKGLEEIETVRRDEDLLVVNKAVKTI